MDQLPKEMQPAAVAGVEETKRVLKFIIELGKGLDKSLSDGKISITDAFNFYGAMLAAGPAFATLAALPIELSNLSEPEIQDLNSFVQAELQLDNKAVEKAIEDGLALALKLYEFVKSLKK